MSKKAEPQDKIVTHFRRMIANIACNNITDVNDENISFYQGSPTYHEQ